MKLSCKNGAYTGARAQANRHTSTRAYIKREQTVELYMHMHQFALNLSFKTKIDIES